MKLLTPLRVEHLTPEEIRRLGRSVLRPHVKLTEKLAFEHAGQTYEIPAGYVSDFASVPKLFWALFPPSDPHYSRAAVIHDWGYDTGGVYYRADCFTEQFNRAGVDDLFREAMVALGCRMTLRLPVYAAVRAWGWRYYGKRKGALVL